MSTLLPIRNFWLPWVTTILLACASDAGAQTSYKVTDLGTLGNDNMSCAMTLNDQGWTAIQDGNAVPGKQDAIGTLLNGRDAIVINGVQVDLGTLGGKNSFMNWGEINDWGQIVGYSETDALDPNGEDICGFGTHLTCRPFLWQGFHMKALLPSAKITGRRARSQRVKAGRSTAKKMTERKIDLMLRSVPGISFDTTVCLSHDLRRSCAIIDSKSPAMVSGLESPGRRDCAEQPKFPLARLLRNCRNKKYQAEPA